MNNLNNLRILNTRPFEQGQELSAAIQKARGIAIDVPGLAIEPISEKWLEQLPSLHTIKQAIFISANAVNYFFSKLKSQAISWPKQIRVIAIGHATAKVLAQWNIAVSYMPPTANSESLIKLKCLQRIKNQTVLLIKGKGGRPEIENTLKIRGANLLSISVYQRVIPILDQEYLCSLWKEDAVDIILFTSEQSMQNIFTLFGLEAKPWLCSKPCIVISSRLAQCAQLLGIRSVIISRHDDLLNTLQGLVHDYSK